MTMGRTKSTRWRIVEEGKHEEYKDMKRDVTKLMKIKINKWMEKTTNELEKDSREI